MQFSGRLGVPESDDPGIEVKLVVERSHVALLSDSEPLGRWPVSQVGVERIGGDRFKLDFGDEELLFMPEDTLGFSYEALPRIGPSRSGGGVLGRLRSAIASRELGLSDRTGRGPVAVVESPAEEPVEVDLTAEEAEHTGTPPSTLPRLLGHLEASIMEVRKGEMNPAAAKAVAELAQAMCTTMETMRRMKGSR